MEDFQETTREINLRDYWRILVKRRWIIAVFFLVCLTTVAIYSLTMTPIYRATAQLMIEKANPNILSTQELVAIDTSGTDFYQTQYQILESRSLAREVIKRLSLSQHPEFKRQEQKGSITSTGIAMPIASSNSPENSAMVGTFLSRLKIQPVRNSRLVKVNFESQDPQLAAKAVNTLAQAYIDWNLGLRLQTQQSAALFLDDQVKEVKRKLEASEQALQQYREKFGVAALTGGAGSKESQVAGAQDISRQKMAQVNAQLGEATNKRIEAEINYKQARDLLQHPDKAETIPEAVNNPVIVSIKSQEVQLLRERTEKGEKFGQKHPTMVALNQEIENLRRKKLQEIRNIVDAMKSKYESYLNQERSLQAALSRSKSETIDRDKIAIQYQVLQQEVDSNRGLYDMLLKRLKETNVSEENRTVNIHVVDPAEPPKNPAKPRVKLNLLLACLVGLMGGIGVAFFLEYLDNTVKTPDDLKQYFNIPYLGPVPFFSIDPERPGSELISLSDPKSSASEAYRGLRTGILFSTPGHSPRSLLITSSGPEEGKTITAANLAITMAQAGQKILMLDCDMRKPRLHKAFGSDKGRGMSNILVGEGDWKTLRVPTGIPNLDIIPSGPIPPNPAELIGSERMKTLIDEILKEYDRVLIDSPPIVAVTDSVVLSRVVEGVVLVIQVGVTARDVIANSIRQLQDVQAHVLGAALNAVNIGKDSYYYYQYYYYYYGEGGDRKRKKQTRRRTTEAEAA
jgi:capsular exopolysaccharide synthesis family protein